MKKEMLINVLQPEECRIAILEDSVLEELYVERTSHESYVGNIYKGKIVNIEPSIQAAFVDFGVGRNGFLHVSDVEPAYYRHLEPHRDAREERGDRGEHRGGRRGNGRGRERTRHPARYEEEPPERFARTAPIEEDLSPLPPPLDETQYVVVEPDSIVAEVPVSEEHAAQEPPAEERGEEAGAEGVVRDATTAVDNALDPFDEQTDDEETHTEEVPPQEGPATS